MLALPFSPTSSRRHYAGFPVAIKTLGIFANFAPINEIMLFGIMSELVSRITWSFPLFYSVYLGKFTATFMLDSRKETRSLASAGFKILGHSTLMIEQGLNDERAFFDTVL